MNEPLIPEPLETMAPEAASQEPCPPAGGAPAKAAAKSSKRRGVVLIAVLVVVASLSLAGYHYSDSMTSEYKASANAHRNVQARAFAASGVHYTAGVLRLMASPADGSADVLGGNPWNNPGKFQNIEINAGGQLKGRFSIIAPAAPDDGSDLAVPYFGVADEGGKINPNSLMKIDPTGQRLFNMIKTLPNMTDDIANSIVAWMGGSVGVTNGGAGSDVYSSMSPSYRAKGGPIDSIDELLLVRGVTRDLLYGTDANRNGSQDANEDGGNGFDRGWSAYLTVYSREPNSDAAGMPYTFLNEVWPALDDTKPKAMHDTLVAGGVSDDVAKFIVLYRQYKGSPVTPLPKGAVPGKLEDLPIAAKSGQTIASIYDLIGAQITVQKIVGSGKTAKLVTTIYPSPLNDPAVATVQFPLLFALTSLHDATDTTGADPQSKELGRINVMTAPRAVLAAIPELTSTDVDNIIMARPKLSPIDTSDPSFSSPLWLYTKAKVSVGTLKKLEKYITTRTQVYRFQSVGFFEGNGPAIRIEAVVDTNAGRPRILMWRDLSELGKGWTDTTP